MQDTAKLLNRIAQAYPDALHVEELLGHIGLESGRGERAVRGLFEGGLITARGTPCVEGVPGSELRLTEPGIAVALGLAGIEDDPRGAITSREVQTVRLLHQARERRSATPSHRPRMPGP
ncbi:MAG: hypothetical protein ABI218_07525 [Caldimonas sp.]